MEIVSELAYGIQCVYSQFPEHVQPAFRDVFKQLVNSPDSPLFEKESPDEAVTSPEPQEKHIN